MSNIMGVGCCGIKEIANINHDQNGLDRDAYGIARRWEYDPTKAVLTAQNSRAAYFIFSVPAHMLHLGEILKGYILEQGLGDVTTVGERLNPNSMNKLTMYVWMPDQEALKAWSATDKKTQAELDAIKERRSKAAKKGWATRLKLMGRK